LLAFYVLILVWIAAITVTDRALAIQFFWWFNPALVLGSLPVFLLAWVLLRIGGSGLRMKFSLAVGGVAIALFFAREFGVFRWLGGFGHEGPPKGRAIRLVHWNMSGFDVAPGVDIGRTLTAAGTPDLLFITIENNPRLWKQIETGMKHNPDDPVVMANLGGYKVFSRFPITHTTVQSIPFSGQNVPELAEIPSFIRRTTQWGFRLLQLHRRSTTYVEPALIIGLTLDTSAVNGQTTHAWFIDLPSNPVIGREDVARRVRARADELLIQGVLPKPDFIAGDFNIPVGSHSLSVYAPGFSPAADSAGLCRLASWPRPKAVLQLDHILVSPAWRAAEYRLIDPGASEHMAQTALLWPADAAPASP